MSGWWQDMEQETNKVAAHRQVVRDSGYVDVLVPLT